MTKAIEAGGKINQCLDLGCAIAFGFESVVLAVLRAESRCDKAKQSVKDRLSIDSDFLTDEEIHDKLKDLDDSYIASRKALTKMLMAHRGIRGIHQNRKEMERRARIISEAESRLL